MLYSPVSVATQTAFAAVHGACLHELVRSIAQLPGSFSRKRIKHADYLYYQTADLTGKQKQIFMGPATEELKALVKQHHLGGEQRNHLKRLAQQAIVLGCAHLVPTHAKIVTRIADAGFFQAGGILVGTHVFMGYQNPLGIRWTSGAQTQDLDFAHAGKNVSIAIPSDVRMDMGSVIDSLKMGFVPVQSLTTYIKSDEPDLQIDFVTCRHRGGDTPVLIQALNATMQPLKFMEYAMESPIQMTLLSQQGPIRVNAPAPEKYALHKLLIYGERPQNMRIKAAKDIEQAAALIEYLSANDSDALGQAWQALVKRGVGWQRRAVQGLNVLKKAYPSVSVAWAT